MLQIYFNRILFYFSEEFISSAICSLQSSEIHPNKSYFNIFLLFKINQLQAIRESPVKRLAVDLAGLLSFDLTFSIRSGTFLWLSSPFHLKLN